MTQAPPRFRARAACVCFALAVLASLFIVSIASSALAIDPAHAPSALPPPSERTGLLRVVLGLAAAFILAIAAAHPFVRRVERRLGLTVVLSGGLPFLGMGYLFRLPSVGILTDDVVADLRPA